MKKLFNFNTGYFLKEHIYYYEGKPYVGYVLCRGYIMFGISGHTKIDTYTNKKEAVDSLLSLTT